MTAVGSLSGKRVFVTGAGGFIGSHLVENAVAEGARVTALVRYNAASSLGNLRFLPRDVLDEVELLWGDVTDAGFLASAMEGAELVFHLAALISIPYSYLAPRAVLSTNLDGAFNVLEAARRRAVGRVVMTSTSEVYGSALIEPIAESHPLQAQSPYAASKIAADALADSYVRSFAADVVTVRPFNVYGPRQSARAFIPAIMVQALWSEAVSLGALTPRRDVTFVQDTVRAFAAAAQSSTPRGAAINVGSGEALTIGDFARRILTIIGLSKPIIEDSRRIRPERSEVMNLRCDAGLADAVLGWRPSIGLDEGLARTLAFIKAHREIYRPERYTI